MLVYLVMTNSLLLKMVFPLKIVIFHSYVGLPGNDYQFAIENGPFIVDFPI